MKLTIYRVALYKLAEDPYTTSRKPPDSWIFVEDMLVTFSWDEAVAYEEEHSKPGPDRCGNHQKLEIERTSVLTTGWT